MALPPQPARVRLRAEDVMTTRGSFSAPIPEQPLGNVHADVAVTLPASPTQRIPSAEEIVERRLITVLSAHHGTATSTALVANGFTAASLSALVADGTLEQVGDEFYQFPDPLAYFPEVVWTAWRIPGAVIGGLSAAIYYGLTVANPQATELVLPRSWHRPLLPSWRVRSLTVPPGLQNRGVVLIAPMAGHPEVQIPMYDRAVAVAQVLATPDHGLDILYECVMMSLGPNGVVAPDVSAAVAAYHVRPMLERALRALGLEPTASSLVSES